MIEERADISVQNIVHLSAADPDVQGIQRIVWSTSGSKPIGEPEEAFLVDRVQHQNRGALDDLVFQGADVAGIMHLMQIAFGMMG